ncbi:MAG TPA: hypothetical protein VIX59_03540 [Candidatus Binataceae bacterium]|jgi:Flp pilus assembly protein TadD
MRSYNIAKLLLMSALATSLAACGVVEAQRQAQQAKEQAFVHKVDMAHIWVSTETPAPGKPYSVLGEMSYTEPFSPDAIDEDLIRDKLKKMAYEKWPEDIDAIVKENQAVSADGTQVTVTAEAIKYDSSVDREALHHMNEGAAASSNGN